MQNFIHEGKVLNVTAPYAVNSGGGVKVGNIFGLAANTYTSGQLHCPIVVEGVVDISKDGSTFSQGDLVYWDDVARKATSTVGSNLLVGAAELPQLTGDANVRTKLFGVPGFSGQVNGVKVAHALYVEATDGGGTGAIVPANSDTIPANAVVLAYAINSPTAPAGTGATIAFGTSAGSAANSIKAATAITALTTDAVLGAICATPFKMSAAGQIQLTVAVAALTAGVIEIWVLYFLASEA